MTLWDNFRAARWFRTANLLLQALLFLTLFGGLNYLAGDHGWRFDLTRYSRFSLSPETLSYLKDLPNPVTVTVTAPEDQVSPEVQGLLREYEYATESNGDRRLTVEYLDIDRSRRRAEDLGIDEPNWILVRCAAKPRAFPITDLYRIQAGEPRSFQGEQVITAAILDVSSPEQKKIYFLVGHGELRPDDVDPERGLSAAREQLRMRNFAVDTVDLSQKREIPADASLLVSVSPQTPFSALEQELLRQYLAANAGRLILFLAPGYDTRGLSQLFGDWGVTVDDDLLRDAGNSNVTEDDDFIVRAIFPHPITQALVNYKFTLRMGPARTVRVDPEAAAANGLVVRTLAASSPTAWGEIDYGTRGAATSFQSGVDIRPELDWDPPGRLGLVVASERVSSRNGLPFSVPRGRLVVFGTGDLIDNRRIANAGAEDIFLGSVNWTVDRDTQLSIPARLIERFQLSLSARELMQLRFSLLLGLPAAAAALGLAVYWARRS